MQSGDASATNAAEERARVLIVDDSPAKRLALASVLEVLDVDLVLAESGKDALRLLLSHEYAVILLDVQMPVMDGFETAALIRGRRQSEVTPIIFVTAYARAETDMLQGYSQNAVDYVFTPIIPEVLRAKVSVFVDLYQKTREIQRQQFRLREKNLELEAANHELELFSHTVSHDLRAPVRHIDGFAHALLKSQGDRLDAEGMEYLLRVRSAAARMSQLIDDLLRLSRVTRSRLRRVKTDLRSVAVEVAADLQRNDPERHVEFSTEESAVAECDARLMRVVIENLLGNAWKFTRRSERPRVEFGRTERNGTSVYFVRDNGAGFDMKYAGKLFGAFQRLHTESEFPGTGVGLATVQRIVHLHGGRIWAESQREKGATFYFTL